ncbi:unnamed protein product [Clonostachys solani]|uniref:F-box domain-containing protein n=1 Tax=Clonostachys solani TaxID=160281 RepID=A0A9N9ZCG1_9HYPO|nr:unnamed protein product [Clonostachys solani]
MNPLPSEILIHILDYLPPCSRKDARLVCRTFNGIVSRSQFTLLASFLDPEVSTATCELIARDLTRRPSSIWSPRCSVPAKLPIPESFILALHVGLAGGRSWIDGGGVGSGKMVGVNPHGLSRRLNRPDITEDNIRQALFRYALYLSYTHHEREDKSSFSWVLDIKFWA